MNILVAGIGNIFLGDDGFGSAVARRLCSVRLPEGVRVRDFGIRGLELGYALNDGVDVAILVDTAQRGGPPGSVYLIEPEAATYDTDEMAQTFSPHGMEPQAMLRWASQLGEACQRVVLVACEPESFGEDTPEQGRIGLSRPVEAAVPAAVELIEQLVTEMHTEGAEHAICSTT